MATIPQAEAPQQLSNASLPAGLITPEFDVAALTVDELREEMRHRNGPTQGSKQHLVQRLTEMIANGETEPDRTVR